MTKSNMSLWEKVDSVKCLSVSKNEVSDVVVVGGGISGLSVAYELLARGKSVIVFEAKELGGGETGRTSAHLSNALDEGYQELLRLFGSEGAQLAAGSHTAAIDWIESVVKCENIDCDFERVDGYLMSDDKTFLDNELKSAQQSGLKNVELNEIKVADQSHQCLRFPGQGQFHVMKYINGLAEAIIKKGGKIFTHSLVTAVEESKHVLVKTEDYQVECQSAVIATNTPFIDRFAMHTKQAAYRSYIVGLAIPHGRVAKALYWDTQEPYHYVRIVAGTDGNDILLVGGEDHKTGQANDAALRFRHLSDWAKTMFGIKGKEVFTWSGQVMEPIDGLAFIGRNPGNENIYIVTGDSGHGLTHGTIAGILISDLILGKKNDWEALYNPSRKNIRALGKFFKQSCNIAAQFAQHFKKGDVESEADIKPGSGAIVKKGLKKLAVYKDDQGIVHACSALCPHLGCIVAWNTSEKTWDCPCHGSRFSATGKVLNGPAHEDLESL